MLLHIRNSNGEYLYKLVDEKKKQMQVIIHIRKINLPDVYKLVYNIKLLNSINPLVFKKNDFTVLQI